MSGGGTAELARLGVHMDPFRAEARGEFLYTDPAWHQRLAAIRETLADNTRPVLVLGEHGLGKTTAVEELLRRTANEWHACRVEAHAEVGTEALMEQILSGLDAPPARVFDDAIRAAGERTAELRRAGRLPVIAVDDADRLSPGSLAALMTLRERIDDPPALLLLATPRIENTLSDTTFRSRATPDLARIALVPFNANQTSAYLEHRLAAAGLTGETPLGPSTVAAIHRDSEGIPARINEQASRALGQATGPAAGRDRFDKRPWMTHLASGLAGALLALAGVSALSPDGDRGPDDASRAAEESTRPLELPPEPATAQRPGLEAGPGPAPGATHTEPTGRGTDAEPGPTETPPVPEDGPAVAATDGAPDRAAAGASAPEAPAEAAPAPERGVSDEPADGDSPAAGAAPGSEPDTATANGSGDDALQSGDWVRAQPPDGYTIQLAAVRQRERLQGFVDRYPLEPPLALVHTQRPDEPDWYVLVNGSFPDDEAARDALARLPEAVRDHGPWTRSFASLQAHLAETAQKPQENNGKAFPSN